MDYSKLPYYLLFLGLFILGQSLSMWGQYVTLPFKNLTMWEAFKMAIPFAWLDWIIMTFTIQVGDKYKLVTPTQDTFLLIIIQFTLVLLINRFYLKQKIYRSDLIAFGIILLGFLVSFIHIISNVFNIPIPKHPTENPNEAHASLLSRRYTTLNTNPGALDLEYSNVDYSKQNTNAPTNDGQNIVSGDIDTRLQDE
uniref:Uncharacterized protein n=1 Tax=viral metagenome TaxID=1070528 RepID=A0A6C0F4T4_9ZZZZ